jgi:hypothetical protein
MKKFLKIFALISILIMITALFVGCAGTAGPAGATGPQGPAGPNLIVALGNVYNAGTLSATCQYNVTSVTWSGAYWEIQLTGISFSIWDYAVAVCPFEGYATQSSMDGKLIIYIWNSVGTVIQTGFSFVVFAQPS